MHHDEFIGQVQHRARLSSRGDAERATRAVLETLAERLDGGEAKDLASQLPREIAYHLTRDPDRARESERLSLDEFQRRVSERSGVDLPAAVHQTRAVISVLDEAASAGEMSDIKQQLGEEFAPLFEYSDVIS